ncbi:hypothetical protein ABEG63_15475 [Chryseobacterium sp. C39-AII1]|uniref:hypothetical protein n=1 Tax=Chryseobacterium sp. C39-AII1 TaxID=3080332 RepID=UPI0032092897
MSDIIIKSNGIKTEHFYVPPFELNKGEAIVIKLINDEQSFNIEMFLKDIFNAKIKHKNTLINQPFTFVDYIREPEFRRIFFPITVGEYLKKNANLSNSYSEKIYEIDWINKKTKISMLPGNPRKLLSLYSVLSKFQNIIVDFAGQDLQGIEFCCNIILEEIYKGGSVIIFDATNSVRNNHFKYIEIELLK